MHPIWMIIAAKLIAFLKRPIDSFAKQKNLTKQFLLCVWSNYARKADSVHLKSVLSLNSKTLRNITCK